MGLNSIEVSKLRNLAHCSSVFSPKFNLIQGANGAGKTSLLEAIHILSLRRSFRTNLLDNVISHQQDGFSVFGKITDDTGVLHRVGINKRFNEPIEARVDGENVSSVAELSTLFPLLLIHHTCHELLDAGSSPRRQFVDWGVFHVEHQFHLHWKRAGFALQQRNRLLKNPTAKDVEINAWGRELERYGSVIDDMRRSYVGEFIKAVDGLKERLLQNHEVTFVYYPGWREGCTLEQALIEKISRDRDLGYTSVGFHRADLKVFVDGLPASQVLSRGQQKLLACTMKLAQGVLLKKLKQRYCVYLLDDLPAELDALAIKSIVEILGQIDSQVFFTGIDNSRLGNELHSQHCFQFELENGLLTQQELYHAPFKRRDANEEESRNV